MDGGDKIHRRAFGAALVSVRKRLNGEMDASGPLHSLIRIFGFIPILFFHAHMIFRYRHLARWRGKSVSNTMAPPNLSGPQWRTVRSFLRSRVRGVYGPVAVNFAVTHSCPGSCPHCSAAAYRRPGAEELSTGEAKRVIDEALALGVSIFGFTGGEPLVRKDIYDLVDHVDKRKAITFLFTNGQLLDDEAIRRLSAAGLYCAYLSLDHPDPSEHDRGRGIPGLAEHNRAAVEKLKANGILAALTSYATRSGTARGEYRGLYEAARSWGAQNLLLLDYIPTGRALRETCEVLTPEQRREIYEYSAATFRERSRPPLTAQAWQNSAQGFFLGLGCYAGNREIYITASGDVTPCDFTPLSFGNVRDEPLARIWRRMRSHPAYRTRPMRCRMQEPIFRKTFIDAIPDGADLPYPIDRLPRVDDLGRPVRR